MDKKRRRQIVEISKELSIIKDQITSILTNVEELKSTEEEIRDNTPESLQGLERYEITEAACDSLEEAYNSIDESIDSLNTAVTALEEITT